jgi:hypothetical protein
MKSCEWRLALLLVGVAISVTACGSTGPSGPDDSQELWIHGYYANLTTTPRVTWSTCVMDVRLGDASGEPVGGLTVSCNGEALPYSMGVYEIELTPVAPGGQVTFIVAGAGPQLTATLVVPDPPSNLELVGGTWDFSDPGGSNTLTWENPATVADSILVCLVAQGPHSWDIFGHSVLLPPDATSATIPNTDVPTFGYAYRIEAGVFQINEGQFATHPGESLLSARCGPVEAWDQ